MRKVVIGHNHHTRAQNPKHYWNQQRTDRKLCCGKCGKHLKVGDTAFRTTRKYLCLECGEKAQIDV